MNLKYPNHEDELHKMMASLAELTRASFEVPQPASENTAFERTQPTGPQKTPAKSIQKNLEDPRVREALAELQKRREASRASAPQGPKIINSHYRAVSGPGGLEKARIHFPRKPHG